MNNRGLYYDVRVDLRRVLVSRPPRDSKLSKVEIGARVRSLRDARGLTQAELGEALALTQSNISAIERGGRGVTIHQAVKLARALRVSVDELLTGTKPMKGSGDRLLRDRRLMRRLQLLEKLPKGDKKALLKTIDAYLLKVS
jgi:transcriptional regulator with XRE-family HTH domain